ncbi:hypothetical protein [Aquiflexum lacus]|uniref:hypothetical protein n=1 Tax=Aquiflexum lacus TaxID=2483805 RepID=UPI00189401E6|nr:hypothetical protein [Aquiflexum lacus]
MKSLFNSLSLLLVLVIGSNSILSGFSEIEDKQLLSFEQDFLSDSQVDGDFHFFVETSFEKILIPSIKIKDLGDAGLGLGSNEGSTLLEIGTLRSDWFKKKLRFFDIQKLLYPFHFFL